MLAPHLPQPPREPERLVGVVRTEVDDVRELSLDEQKAHQRIALELLEEPHAGVVDHVMVTGLVG